MTIFARKLITFGFCFEVIIFCLLYYFGPNGIHIISELTQQKKALGQDVVIITQEIQGLEGDIARAKTPFAKEKIARERLYMKKNNETVFFKK